MKQVNGDMEDLFRRASEKYPLRTDSADWDSLAAALDKDPGPPSDADKDDKRRRRGIFWWWLLLPLAVGAGIYSWHATDRPSAHLSKAGTQGAGVQAGTQGAGTQPGGSSAGEARPLESTAQGGGISAQPGGTTVGSEGGPTARGTELAGGAGSTAAAAGRTRLARSTTGSEVGSVGGTGSKAAGRTQPTGSTAKAGSTGGGNVTSDDLFDAADKNMTGGMGRYGNSAAGEAVASRLDLRRVPTAGSYSVVVDVKTPAARKDSSAKQTKKATAKSNGGHGYIGLTGAPDFSTVKMQATKGVGTTWGLLLGYAFNSRWAVESGVYLDRKKYYTAGEYFKGETQPYMTLQSANGSCNMWEIPLNVRYNLNPGSKITWFATTGVSSYFMTKQQYAYQYEGVPWPTNWSTSVHANYLFSIINLSGGFEQRIGRIGNLRIEPYLRIPLSGIGTGRLPIMSAGLNVGITHQLW